MTGVLEFEYPSESEDEMHSNMPGKTEQNDEVPSHVGEGRGNGTRYQAAMETVPFERATAMSLRG